MEKMCVRCKYFFDDESGVTAIEYALLASLIAVAILGGVSATGNSLRDIYTYWSGKVLAAINSVP